MRPDGQGTDERVTPEMQRRLTKPGNTIERDVIRLAVTITVLAVIIYGVVTIIKQRQFLAEYQSAQANSADPTLQQP